MPSPFPGMDPYLEHPEIWPGVHLLLIAALTESLTPQLRPKYSVSVEVRMYETSGEQSLLVGIPDVSIQSSVSNAQRHPSQVTVSASPVQPIRVTVPIPETVRQGYLEIRKVATKEVITAIEVLSPVNKRPGKGRQTYESKRERILGSSTHLVEIDLLRVWEPMPVFANGSQNHYRILVSRGDCRPSADLYAFNLQDAIAPFPLPLRAGDREPIIDLQALLSDIYDRAGYDLKLDYTSDPIPPLSATDAAWANALLIEKGWR
ncbi:DUF4058 family protein [Nostoc sp. 106C]|uniref:DUF4058 family protein n=1 Tax=Nostoc sp. 106C TaxID=1932667 RepID=UPI000A39CEF1|nr:DUF4058 family protein [Nostoc sp. 106C]OUL35268.1 hypothetical protein BV375_02230 [Nostoc sp. 106C]